MVADTAELKGQALLDAWQAARARGTSQQSFADQLGMPLTTLKSRLSHAVEHGVVQESRRREWTDHLRLVGDALVLGDMHIPFHNGPFINQCIAMARAAEVDRVILSGDVLEFSALARWPEDWQAQYGAINSQAEQLLRDLADELPQKYRTKVLDRLEDMARPSGDLGEEIAESRRILTALAGAFREVVWMMGNHETRLIRRLEKALPAASLADLFVGSSSNLVMTPYYFCELESAGEVYRITHPKNWSKGSSKRLVPIHGCHIIMAHGHHFAVQSDPSGRWLAIEPGACYDPARLDYERLRDGIQDTHIVGAVLITGGRAQLINRWMNLEGG